MLRVGRAALRRARPHRRLSHSPRPAIGAAGRVSAGAAVFFSPAVADRAGAMHGRASVLAHARARKGARGSLYPGPLRSFPPGVDTRAGGGGLAVTWVRELRSVVPDENQVHLPQRIVVRAMHRIHQVDAAKTALLHVAAHLVEGEGLRCDFEVVALHDDDLGPG